MEDNKSTNVKKTVKSGITFGSALASKETVRSTEHGCKLYQ